MAKIDLQLANKLVRGANSQAGNGYLDYYQKHNVYHPGWDVNVGYGNQDLGLPVTCPAKGEVIFVSRRAFNGGFGLHMVIRHEGLQMFSHWLHLDKVVVKKGDRVSAGEHIANVGKTGTGYAHLHLEVYNTDHEPLMRSRNYRFYPSGYSRAWVKKRYMDPAKFVKEGEKQAKEESGVNVVQVYLYKDKNSPKIYLKGKDGLYHHIGSENVFKAFFGGFKDVRWEVGPAPKKSEIGKAIN